MGNKLALEIVIFKFIMNEKIIKMINIAGEVCKRNLNPKQKLFSGFTYRYMFLFCTEFRE